MSEPIKIAIAEDFELERKGLIALLKEYEDLNVVLSAGNGRELLEGLKKIKPDIILLDIEMSVMGGRETFNKLKTKYPKIKVIMLTEHFTDSYIVEFISKGAASFLSKNNRIEKVVETIRRVHLYGSSYDTVVSNILANADLISLTGKPVQNRSDLNLTSREIEIIRLMCAGKENAGIANLLNIDVRTVEGHRNSVWSKTGCKNIVDLIEYSFKNNLISI